MYENNRINNVISSKGNIDMRAEINLQLRLI
jgi:hypothetical protein